MQVGQWSSLDGEMADKQVAVDALHSENICVPDVNELA
jgi:hypothetical protein